LLVFSSKKINKSAYHAINKKLKKQLFYDSIGLKSQMYFSLKTFLAILSTSKA